ncbi:Tigger transposable element-derived protein 4 [Nymphon striatum]|nr:Tigger transposable element-derived protein 4 [Nymphon striatum]
MSGKRGDVNNQTVCDWKVKVPKLCEGYDQKNIFNMDETGLFFRDTGRKTLHFKDDGCPGGKRSKERITVALCASMMGEKMKPVVIGKSRCPRCFGKIDIKTLPVHYYNNKKAWMTSKIYEDYLHKLNRQMRAQQRHILLFVDNAPSHPELKFSHVKVLFLPPNTTSCTQLMDQGIIHTTKLKFRKRQLLHLTKEMDRQPAASGTVLLKQISILDAIYWLKNSWTEVEESTIQKCFSRCGFGIDDQELGDELQRDMNTGVCESNVDDDDNIPLAAVKLSLDLFGCSFRELSQIDKDLHTCDINSVDWNSQANEILANLVSDNCVNEDDSDDEDDIVSLNTESNCITMNEAHGMVQKLKTLAVKCGSSELMGSLQAVDEQLTVMTVQKSKQTKI